MLRRSNKFLNSRSKRLLYFGQIHSNLVYSLGIWGPMLSCNQIQKISKAQSTAIKLIDPQLSLTEINTRYKILKFEDLIALEQCKWGYKLTHDLLPYRLTQNLTLDHKKKSTTKTHSYSTRNKKNPNLPNVTGTKYRISFLFQSIKHYNGVNRSTKESPTLASFVCACKKTLLDKYR